MNNRVMVMAAAMGLTSFSFAGTLTGEIRAVPDEAGQKAEIVKLSVAPPTGEAKYSTTKGKDLRSRRYWMSVPDSGTYQSNSIYVQYRLKNADGTIIEQRTAHAMFIPMPFSEKGEILNLCAKKDRIYNCDKPEEVYRQP